MPRKIGGSLFVEMQEQLLFIACNWSRLHFFNYSSLNISTCTALSTPFTRKLVGRLITSMPPIHSCTVFQERY